MTQPERRAPSLRETVNGWLAVAPADGPQIAVVGSTEAEAREKFDAELDYWIALRTLAQVTPVTDA